MSTTAAIIYALLSLAAVIAAVVLLFWLRDVTKDILHEDLRLLWRAFFGTIYIVLWAMCFILELILVIFTIWLAYDTAKSARDWWHKGAK